VTNILWRPSAEQIANTPVEHFRAFVNERFDLSLQDYPQLHSWSVESTADFWSSVWDFNGIVCEHKGDAILNNAGAMPGANWFPGAKLNYAANLLRRNDDGDAIVFKSENGDQFSLSHAQLRSQVASLSRALRAHGIVAGDRVAGFVPNIPQAIVAMLAAASIGAVWSSCSPDFGLSGVLDRFGQIEPKIIFTADGYHYNGKTHDSLKLVSELVEKIPSVERVIVIDYIGQSSQGANDQGANGQGENSQGEKKEHSKSQLEGRANAIGASFEQLINDGLDSPLITEALPFDHPLFIMFSSGTTGKPKCIVHGAGGTLLQHVKEHQLHVGLQTDQKIFFFTTCGWMMWNWLVSGLAAGGTLLLYDGSPFYPDGNVLFDYAQSSGMHYLGTSAKFIDACNKAGISPATTHQLPQLKSVLSTGSPLVPESFDYIYEKVAKNVCVSSMSGGTDIISCFALGNPALPVVRGELQCIGLGMDVQSYSDDGRALPVDEKGELVCVKPFPCMPVGFFNDADGSRYHAAYFDRFDNVWCHGDYISLTDSAGMVIYGRSDAVLNPGGVRIGTAEIYRQVEQFDEVVESLVIGQSWQNDVRVVLFVRLRETIALDDELIDKLKKHIRTHATPRHVPARVVQVSDIPRTRSGKIVELAVRKIVHGESVDNLDALANPEALDLFKDRPELAT